METEAGTFGERVTAIFQPILQPLFAPVNDFLAAHYQPYATICAMLLFLGGAALVFRLKKEYVNLDAPGTAWYYDLRIWTIVALLPHMTAYIYFTKW